MDEMERRFFEYQIRAMQRYQRLRHPRSKSEAELLAHEWVYRFAEGARARWQRHLAVADSANRSKPAVL